MPKVTCRYCKNKIDKKDAFLEEYLNDNLEIKNRYYCNKECLKEFKENLFKYPDKLIYFKMEKKDKKK